VSQRPGGGRRTRRTEQWGHVHHVLQDAQWWFIAGLAVAAAALGLVGFRDYERAVGGPTGFWDVTYRTLQLFTLESGALDIGQAIPPSLQVARFLAPAVMAGALVRATLGLFRDQAQLLHVRIIRSHVVVCGVGRKGLALARSLRERGYQVVAIDQDEENDLVESCRSAGVPVLIGDATDIEVLRKAGVGRAAFVVALCGESGTNAQIAALAQRLSERRRRSLTCLAHVLEPELCSLLRTRFPAAGDHAAFRLEFFDIYERAARVMMQRHRPFGDTDADAVGQPHLLVIGLGRLGRSVVVQAARNWKSGQHTPGRRFLITVVDPGATDAVRALRARHPELDTVCRIEPAKAYDGSGTPPVTVAYVCIGNDAQALQTGLLVHEQLQDQGTTVVIRGRTQQGLPALLRTTEGSFDGLDGFALLDQTCDAGLLLGGLNEALAQLLHTSYVRTREAQGWTYGAHRDAERRTHPALAPWPELEYTYKDSNRDQAAHTWVKLAAVRCELAELIDWDAEPFSFTDDEFEALARLEHQRWMAYQQRTARRAKALRRRPHQDLVPWNRLPGEEQDIDRGFVRALPQVLAQLGYQIVRRPS